MIHLAVGKLEIEWGKNNGFVDHAMLFQGERDIADVPYYYTSDADHSETVVEYQEGLSRPLKSITKRLDLLGHTLEHARAEYAELSELNGFSLDDYPFEELQNVLKTVDVTSLSSDYGEGGEDFGKFFRREVGPRLGMNEASLDFSQGMENLSSWTILRLLSENKTAQDLPVMWAFHDIETGGWEPRETFVRNLTPFEQILIVTEGSTDASVIRQAFKLLRPDIADFFRFVDMQEGYPFSGTGNLFRFVQGLISISATSDILVLFDNDAAGIATYNRCSGLNLPDNFRVLKLPDLEAFGAFPTIGPTGESLADINGRAAAIECYLDLDAGAKVQWGGFNEDMQTYQGALMGKDRHTRAFLKQTRRLNDYDYSKLERVVDALVASASEMRGMRT
ncbi:HEPN/Toprim-associated domain-containing protein [Hyphomonas sp. FCG-A18]|uniref:HEPN/Toprim-associated domain-containing protein n=1 Tax=Hyphomonas sp. FCG-A18 TaxID=3080019 RepID=UPI002B29CEBC|nr:HEPN/Toprim-associated domain-containing protein [Hyphomonas sp. FCG-A18]